MLRSTSWAAGEDFRASAGRLCPKEHVVEIFSIAFTGALIWVCALVQNLTLAVNLGPRFVMSDRSRPPPDDGFSGRVGRTLRNNLESAAMFIPVTVSIALLHGTSALSVDAALLYVLARVLFTLFYWLGSNKARSTAWTVGMGCIAILFVRVMVLLVA